VEGRDFQALDVDRKFTVPFISTALFHNGTNNDLFVVGPSYRTPGSALTAGYFLPLSLTGPAESLSFQGSYRGYTLFSAAVDRRYENDTVVYLVGWVPNLQQQGYIKFGVVRAHLNMDGPFNTRGFYWNEETDVLPLYEDDYNPFHSTFRPHLFLETFLNRLYVVDPSSLNIYSIFLPNSTTALMRVIGNYQLATSGYISGLAWSPFRNQVYIGFAGIGFAPGKLLTVDLPNLRILNTFNFPEYYSVPAALTEFNGTLYIGFTHGPGIISFNVNTYQIRGIQRTPHYLSTVYRAFDAGFDHVYFITHEQHSKVFRVNKHDFCDDVCPYNGYCLRGKCTCSTPWLLSKDLKACELPVGADKEHVVVEKGAAVAMGVLFAVTVVVAAAGWFLWYKGKHSAYSAV